MAYNKLALSLLLVMVFGVAAFAQEAQVKVKVSPKEAYVFLDGVPIGNNTRDLFMTPGKHTIGVYNYGFAPQVQEIDAQPGKNPELSISLQPKGEPVSGPFGALHIEGGGRAAVLVNGKTPDYFVGHGDEFNNHLVWKQQLLLPPGTHQVTLTWRGTEVFSGPVTIQPNMRTILWVNKGGTTTTEPWSDLAKPISRPRFESGAASTMVVVAPVSGQFTATPGQIDCNELTKLAWMTKETVHAEIADGTNTQEVPPPSGEQSVSPRHTTTYTFEASGPGGVVKETQTVNVNPVVQSSLSSSVPEIHYLKVGDQVVTHETADLNWTVKNADAISLQPLGTVPPSGSREVTPVPTQAQNGPVDETKQYTLTATNVCGGSDTKNTSLHLVGAIEPALTSIFFPTGYPDRRHPDLGLLESQQKELERVASIFRIYMDHNPEAKLTILGYTDPRDTAKANVKLSQRRAAKVKAYLVAMGIPEDKIQTESLGKSKVLDRKTVEALEAQHPPAPEAKLNGKRTAWLAYNRRVDIVMMPVALESIRQYPHEATDARTLWQAPWPSYREIEKAR